MNESKPAIAPLKLGKAAGQAGEGERNSNQKYLRNLLHALQAVRGGNFSARLSTDGLGLAGKIADAFNDIVSANETL